MKNMNHLRSRASGLGMLVLGALPSQTYSDVVNRIIPNDGVIRTHYSDNEQAFIEYRNGKLNPASLVSPARIAFGNEVDSHLVADSLQVEKHLVESLAKGHIAHIRMLDAMANVHPSIASRVVDGVQLKLNQDDFRDVGVEITGVVSELTIDPQVKIFAKISEEILKEIPDIDPNNVQGTDLAQIEYYLKNTQLGNLSYFEGDPFRTSYVDERLFASNDDYTSNMSLDSDTRHELSYKISLLRKVSEGGSLTYEEKQLFPYNPEDYRDKIQGMFQTINGVHKQGEEVYIPLPNYEEQADFIKLFGNLILETKGQIDRYKYSDPDIGLSLELVFEDTINVLQNSDEAEERNNAYSRLMHGLNTARIEAQGRAFMGALGDMGDKMDYIGMDVSRLRGRVDEVHKELAIVDTRLEAMEKGLKDLGKRMGVTEEKLDLLAQKFSEYEAQFDGRVTNIVKKELEQAQARKNFNIAGHNFGKYYNEQWANGLHLGYESTRLIQSIAYLSGDQKFISQAINIEQTSRHLIGITKGVTQVADAIEKLQDTKKALDSAQKIAEITNIVTGFTNIVGAAASIASLFIDSGPSPEEIMIDMLQDILNISQDILEQTYVLEDNQKVLSIQIRNVQRAISHLENDNKEQAKKILASTDFTQGLINLYSSQILKAIAVSQLDETLSDFGQKVVAFNQGIGGKYENIYVPEMREEIAGLSTFLVTKEEVDRAIYPSVTFVRPANIEEFSSGAYQAPYDLSVSSQIKNPREVFGQFNYLTEGVEAGSQLIMLPILLSEVHRILEESGRSISDSQYQLVTNMKNPGVIESVVDAYLAASSILSPDQVVHGDLGKILEQRLEEVVDGNQELRALIPIVYDVHIEKLGALSDLLRRNIEMYNFGQSGLNAFLEEAYNVETLVYNLNTFISVKQTELEDVNYWRQKNKQALLYEEFSGVVEDLISKFETEGAQVKEFSTGRAHLLVDDSLNKVKERLNSVMKRIEGLQAQQADWIKEEDSRREQSGKDKLHKDIEKQVARQLWKIQQFQNRIGKNGHWDLKIYDLEEKFQRARTRLDFFNTATMNRLGIFGKNRKELQEEQLEKVRDLRRQLGAVRRSFSFDTQFNGITNILPQANTERIRGFEDIFSSIPSVITHEGDVEKGGQARRLEYIAESMGLVSIVDSGDVAIPIQVRMDTERYTERESFAFIKGNAKRVVNTADLTYNHYATRYIVPTDIGMTVSGLSLGEIKADNFQPNTNGNLWYRDWDNWNGPEWVRFLNNDDNGSRLHKETDSLVNRSNVGREQLKNTTLGFLEQSRNEAQQLWEDLLLGSVDNPEFDLPEFLKVSTRFRRPISGQEIAELQADLYTTLRQVTILQHALKVFVGAGWGECTSYVPVLAELESKIEAGQMPDFNWLTDEARSQDLFHLYEELLQVSSEIHQDAEKIAFLHTVDTEGICSLGLGNAEQNLARVRGLKELNKRYMDIIKQREY